MDRRIADRRAAWADHAQRQATLDRYARAASGLLELKDERRRAQRRAALADRLDAAKFNHALAAWHHGPEYFRRWQAQRRAIASQAAHGIAAGQGKEVQ